jgi:hypothetical protein
VSQTRDGTGKKRKSAKKEQRDQVGNRRQADCYILPPLRQSSVS